MMHRLYRLAHGEGGRNGAEAWRFPPTSRIFLLVECLILLTVGFRMNPVLRAERAPGSPARVIFTKEFPHSQPDYYSVVVDENGHAVYRTAPDDDSPLEFQLPPETAAEIFSLAGKLNWFRDRNLESIRHVANMGKKTLTYQKGEDRSEASFNHTELPEAIALTALFEKISQTEQHLLRLKYMIRFDRLGVEKELLQLEVDLDQGRLLGAAQLAAVLDQIQHDRSLVHVAQTRAAEILGKIKSGKY